MTERPDWLERLHATIKCATHLTGEFFSDPGQVLIVDKGGPECPEYDAPLATYADLKKALETLDELFLGEIGENG